MAVPTEPEAPASLWQRIEYGLDQFRKAILNLLAVGATLLVGFAITKDAFSVSYEVDPLDVSSSLTGGLLDPEGVAAQLRDQIGLAWHRANSHSPIKVLVKDADEPAFAISGTSLPLRYVSEIFRDVIRVPVTRISGQVVAVAADPAGADAPVKGDPASGAPASGAAKVRVTLRITTSPSGPYFDQVGPYDTVMKAAAVASLAQIDPYAAATAMSQGTSLDRQRGLLMARTALAAEPAGSRALGRGHLTEATGLMALSMYPDAESAFNQAIEEFRRPPADTLRLADAYDGLATLNIIEKNFDRARAEVKEALANEPVHESALYHLVEIEDKQSQDAFNGGGADRFCEAERHFRAAKANYLVFEQTHPALAVVYTQQATMQFLRLNWLRHKDNVAPPCDGLPAPAPIATLVEETRRAFDVAVAQDDQNPASWFQYANMLVELQDSEHFSTAETDAGQRRVLLDQAIDDYRAAIALASDDFYIWFRYAEALAAMGALRGRQDGANAFDGAFAAYCRSITLNRREPAYITKAQDAIMTIPGHDGGCG